jgi:hypothetical protein
MPVELKPVPDDNVGQRADIANTIRNTATTNSKNRAPRPAQASNGDLARAQSGTATQIPAVGTFTKGLAHDDEGCIARADLEALVTALNQPHPNAAQNGESPFPGVYASGRPAQFDAPLYAGTWNHTVDKGARGWESPLAGHVFDLQGADADAVGMPSAPEVGSAELTAEMAELYCAALLRDMPFVAWDTPGDVQTKVQGHVDALAAVPFFSGAADGDLDALAKKRRDARLIGGPLSPKTVLRGSTPGAMRGPYVSQFLLIGNEGRKDPSPGSAATVKSGIAAQTRAATFGPSALTGDRDGTITAADGVILYGVQGISQKFRGHMEKVDHMTTWSSWLDVQNGADLKNVADYFQIEDRFIHTPRDLATYVHYDALYQAYLNAVLILSGMGADTDVGLPEGGNAVRKERDAFATFGGPHILTLITEVATRALKAVRRQKFNIHLRARPEAIAGAVSLAWKGDAAANALGAFQSDCESMKDDLLPILKAVQAHNNEQNLKSHALKKPDVDATIDEANALLPMAFPEGSPMHPAYGAGHATVAGACVTIAKAFFEMYDVDKKRGEDSLYDVVEKSNDGTVIGYPGTYPAHLFESEKLLTQPGLMPKDMKKFAYNPLPSGFVPNDTGSTLVPWTKEALTIQGELDKLAANISIGRNFAGVHYYTDYYESLRMGERIAVSILQDQMHTYREPVSMRFTSFDGDHVMIAGTGGSKGSNDSLVFVWTKQADGSFAGGNQQAFRDWWNRHR